MYNSEDAGTESALPIIFLRRYCIIYTKLIVVEIGEKNIELRATSISLVIKRSREDRRSNVQTSLRCLSPSYWVRAKIEGF